MKSIQEVIGERVTEALVRVVGPEQAPADALVRPTQDPRFGDYQSNVALALAKQVGRKPRELAEQLVAALEIDDVCEPPEIAGPGFVNFRVRPAYLAAQLESIQADPRLGIPPAAEPQRVVIDFSSPNLAKEMHVGHLPSSVIGDSLARLLEFEGHDVLRLNHVGDWGTQFGLLLEHVREAHPEAMADPESFHVDDLEQFYIEAKGRFDTEPEFADGARRAVVDLQAGDPTARRLWDAFCGESLRHCHAIYARLGIRLIDRGESFYNDRLPSLVAELEEKGIAVENEGALCIFLPGFTSRDGTPQPMIIRKSDGGFNYDTTDLAALEQRVKGERAQRIIYVTDKRQADHFKMLFAAGRLAGLAPPEVALEHVGFGMVLSEDRRPFKTREGGTVKLKELLDEAEARALAKISEDPERREAFSDAQRQEIARAVGLGAVKHSALNHNLVTDYVFDWDTMLAMNGNTAPYLLYAYTRTRSIERRAGIQFASLPRDLPLFVEHESEVALAKQLLNLQPVLAQVALELRPHHLSDYLYELSRAFSTFWDAHTGVRVLNAETEALRNSRLRLCDLTARTLRLGLHLLGIEVVEQM